MTSPTGRASRHRAFTSDGLADGRKLALIERTTLHRSMLQAFADGLRHGVEVANLDGYQAFQDLQGMTVINQRRGRIRLLESRAQECRSLARRARENANAEPDPATRTEYMDDARSYSAEGRGFTEEANRLKALEDPGSLPDSFDGEVGFLLDSLTALLDSSDGICSRDQAAALHSILRDFRIAIEGSELRWSACLLVPADGRVLSIGPFGGVLPLRGQPITPAEVDELSNSTGAAQRRRKLIHQLEEAGYPRHLARAATLAPGFLLPRVLLGEDVTWPDCVADFDHAGFNEHLRQTWSKHPAWAAGVYCHKNIKRQALADTVALLGGRAPLVLIEPFLARYDIRRNDIYSMTLPKRTSNLALPAWPATVMRENEWSSITPVSESILRNPTCPRCQAPATAVVRVLEVPDALLCRQCRVMPSRGDLVFPPLYLSLALPPIALPDLTDIDP